MLRTHTSRSLVFTLMLSLFALPAIAQDAGLPAILEELRSLRDDLNAFLIPADVSGAWQNDNYACDGNMPQALLRVVEDAGADISIQIRQYGNNLIFESGIGGVVTFSPGLVRGDQVFATREIETTSGYVEILGNITIEGSGRGSVVDHATLVTDDGVTVARCTAQTRRTGPVTNRIQGAAAQPPSVRSLARQEPQRAQAQQIRMDAQEARDQAQQDLMDAEDERDQAQADLEAAEQAQLDLMDAQAERDQAQRDLEEAERDQEQQDLMDAEDERDQAQRDLEEAEREREQQEDEEERSS